MEEPRIKLFSGMGFSCEDACAAAERKANGFLEEHRNYSLVEVKATESRHSTKWCVIIIYTRDV